MSEYETLRSLHDELCAAKDPLGTPPFLRRIEAELSPAAHRGRRLFAERSAEPSHPDAGPVPTAHAPDRFELLRRAKDLAVGLGDAYDLFGYRYQACSASSTRRRAGLCTPWGRATARGE